MHHSLESIFRDHSAWLLDRVRRRTMNLHTAEDVVGETFVQVVGYRKLDEVREPRALLTTIAQRVLYESWRRRDLERAYLDELATRPAEQQGSPEDRLIAVQTLHQIDLALKGLPSRARQAFVYSALTEMGYAEIATRLGVSVSMIRQYIARAMAAVVAAAAIGPTHSQES